MKNRNLLVALGAAVIVIIIGVLIKTRTPNVPGPSGAKTVNVAMNLPLTGPLGIYGQTIRDGATMAAEDVHKKDEKFSVNLDIQDNTGASATAGNILQKQLLNTPDIYSSGVKPQTMAIFDRVKEAKMPYFVWVFDAYITDKNPNVFRTWVNYKNEPDKYLQYIQFKKAKRVAIACVNLPHTTEEFNTILIPKLKQMGIQANIEIYDLGTKLHRDVILKLKTFQPDLYILNGFQEDLVALVRAVRTYGLFTNDNVIGTYDLLDAANILSKEELEGMRVVAPDFNINSSPATTKWRNRFATKYNRQPLYTDAYSYDMIQIIADAGKRLQKLPASSDDWTRALMATNLDGITGHLAFDEGKDLKLNLKIGCYTDGVLKTDSSEQGK